MSFQKKAGDTAKWTSKARGTATDRSGIVLATIAAHASVVAVFKNLLPNAKIPQTITNSDVSQSDRYLVEVEVGKRKSVKRYFTPRATAVDGKPKAAKATGKGSRGGKAKENKGAGAPAPSPA